MFLKENLHFQKKLDQTSSNFLKENLILIMSLKLLKIINGWMLVGNLGKMSMNLKKKTFKARSV